MRFNGLFESLVLASVAGYQFYRWSNHAAYGSGFWFTMLFNSATTLVLGLPASLAFFNRFRATPVRGTIATIALVVGLCFLETMGQDLWRFKILGGPGSKEMAQLLAAQTNILPGAELQWLHDTATRIRCEFLSTIVVTCLIACYISRLTSSHALPTRKQVDTYRPDPQNHATEPSLHGFMNGK